MMNRHWRAFMIAALLSAGNAPAQEAGTAVKQDDIKAEPFKDAKTVGTVKKGEVVSILKKQGGWMEIKAGPNTGWVRVLSVRKGAGGAGAASEIAGVAGVATGRAGTGQVVSTTGVRGLDDQDLKSAKFSEEEVKKAEAAAISAEEAKKFAAQGELSGRKVAWLPASSAAGNRGR